MFEKIWLGDSASENDINAPAFRNYVRVQILEDRKSFGSQFTKTVRIPGQSPAPPTLYGSSSSMGELATEDLVYARFQSELLHIDRRSSAAPVAVDMRLN